MDRYIDMVSSGIANKLVEILGKGLSCLGNNIGYCIKTSWEAFVGLVNSGKLDEPLIILAIAAVILWQLGMRCHTKYVYWSWVLFFMVRWITCS